MNWQPGDRAIAQNCLVATYLNGQECEIVSLMGPTEYPYIVTVHGCPSTHFTGEWGFAAKHLRPIYDGNETVSWESMKDIYQPSPVVTV